MKPIFLAPEAWARSRNEEKSAVPSGKRTAPSTLPPAASIIFEASASMLWPAA